MNIAMMNDNVLVAELAQEKEETTEAGIILTKSAKKDDAPPQGMIIAVGPEVDSALIKPQALAWCNWKEGTIVDVDGKQAVILPSSAILAVQA